MDGTEIKQIRLKLDKTQEEFADIIGVSKNSVQLWETGKRNISLKYALKIKEITHNNTHLQLKDEEVLLNNNGNEFSKIDDSLYLMKLPLLEIEAQAGFVDNFQDVEYLNNINKHHVIVVDKVYRGKYVAFRVNGESMVDGTYNSIMPNQIVSCRELGKQHWKDKIRFTKRPYWVIITKLSSYPLLKQITEHDIEKGIIKCHSLNTSPEYTDFYLSLNDVKALYYVVDINKKISSEY